MSTVYLKTFNSAHSGFLPGGRLHLNEGPIDLVIGASGSRTSIETAFRTAKIQFNGLLSRLAKDLPILRKPVKYWPIEVTSPVSKRMIEAVQPYVNSFITPMAAVAGSVADEICGAIATVDGITKAYVNDGGDIALFLTPGNTLTIGLVPVSRDATLEGTASISFDTPIRGIASSGMDGRSFSFGIADCVTVLSKNAASADAAATIIGNAVNAEHPAIERAPATNFDPDSDLGQKLITVKRGTIPDTIISEALENGLKYAQSLRTRGIISAAYLACAGQIRVTEGEY